MADRFGWTPEQVDNLPMASTAWLLAMSAMAEEVRAKKAEESK